MNIFNIKIKVYSKEEINIVIKKNNLFTFINPFSILEIKKKLLKEEINNFIIFVDGSLICWLLELFYKTTIERVSFDDTSLAPIVFKYAEEEKKKIYIIGAKRNIAEIASKYIIERYPNIIISKCRNGYFKDENEKNSALKEAVKSDIVITGMGTPYQEQFLLELKNLGWQGTGFTCGGYLDQLVEANGNNYYPNFINKFNLRWIYRIYKEPSRLWKRYFIIYPKFLFLFLLDFIKQKFKRN